MKPQEIFDAASAHLMGMNGPSVDADGDVCVYRGRDEDGEFNGSKCAVGLFISDEHYDCGFEGNGITGSQPVSDAVAASWEQENLTDAQLMLLADLQNAHDHIPVEKVWSESIILSLDSVATKFHLRFYPEVACA